MNIINNPSKYKQYGATSYIKNFKIDKETGEILTPQEELLLDIEKTKEEEKYDGYSALITSELDADDEHIVQMYKNLWKIEDNFKVTKSILETRPVYVRKEDSINAHFLTCFISLLIVRLSEIELGSEYSINKILDTLREIQCIRVSENLWVSSAEANPVLQGIVTELGVDLNKRNMTTQGIRSIIGETKV